MKKQILPLEEINAIIRNYFKIMKRFQKHLKLENEQDCYSCRESLVSSMLYTIWYKSNNYPKSLTKREIKFSQKTYIKLWNLQKEKKYC